MKVKVTEEIWKEGDMYVSYCPELDMASCGKSVEEAKKNLKEVISINFVNSTDMFWNTRILPKRFQTMLRWCCFPLETRSYAG